ncbi:MAG: hypothetical protein HA494_02380 [Thaumarchaeota archaeon]|nr:hypothetical protein [Nitrososphaerota archaeon]
MPTAAKPNLSTLEARMSDAAHTQQIAPEVYAMLPQMWHAIASFYLDAADINR